MSRFSFIIARNRHLPLLAFALLLLIAVIGVQNTQAQLIIQTPAELGINEAEIEAMLETAPQDPSFPQFDMVGAQDTQGTPGSPRLAECLTVERKLSLFYEYAREVGPVVSRRLPIPSNTPRA